MSAGKKIRAEVTQNQYCCGLMELGEFYDKSPHPEKQYNSFTGAWDIVSTAEEGLSPKEVLDKYAVITVTTQADKTHSAWLKKNKFKKVGKWRNPKTRNHLTLWAWFPKKRKK